MDIKRNMPEMIVKAQVNRPTDYFYIANKPNYNSQGIRYYGVLAEELPYPCRIYFRNDTDSLVSSSPTFYFNSARLEKDLLSAGHTIYKYVSPTESFDKEE